MPVTHHAGRTFDRKPMFFDRRMLRLDQFITPTMRRRATAIDRQLWDFPANRILDQGDTGHCVGFGWAGWGICLPVTDPYGNADANRIYYESVAIGGYPNSEDGSTTLWGAKAMQQAEKRLDTSAFAMSLDDIVTWLAMQGPIVTGTNWYDSMMDTDATGQVHVSGYKVGEHEYLMRGFDRALELLYFVQSWGAWGALKGFFTMSFADYQRLFDEQGDACTAVELPLPEPQPEPPPTPPPTPPPQPSGCLTRVRRAWGAELKGLTGKTSDITRVRRAWQVGLNDLNKPN